MKHFCSTDRCFEHHGFKRPRLRPETHQGSAGKGGRQLWAAKARYLTVRVEDIIAEPLAFYQPAAETPTPRKADKHAATHQ